MILDLGRQISLFLLVIAWLLSAVIPWGLTLIIAALIFPVR